MIPNEGKRIKCISVFGTRPEAIKMAPLVKKLQACSVIESRVCVTAQHREMLDTVLELFDIKPDHDLNLMKHGQTITDMTVRILKDMEKVIVKESPDIILVHGDTTTTFTAALAAFYQKIPVGHVEAGLRSNDIYSPYPEEMNRRMTGDIASIHFAPTLSNRDNLVKCGVDQKDIIVTGNTVIDALQMVVRRDYLFPEPLLNELDFEHKKILLLTVHRRENWGERMSNIFFAIKKIVESNIDTEVVFPVHLNPVIRELAHDILGNVPRIHLIEPLDYGSFSNLMAKCYMVLTDSGGIQEEAPALGKPVLVLRTETERPEAVKAGTVKIAGVCEERIVGLTEQLLKNKRVYKKMARAVNPYGDGRASERILKALLSYFK